MKNYRNSDYALNKYSEGIVYRFADGKIITITLIDYLIENPDKTDADFHKLKKISDDDYFKRDRDENAQTKLNVSFEDLPEISAESPEEIFIDIIDENIEAKRRQKRLKIVNIALSKLTKKERRRYLLNIVNGFNERQIAKLESTTQQAISKSLLSAEEKIKKFLSSTKKD